jgi:hypothetical protein
MITVPFCLFSEQIIRDAETNKMSVVNILDGILAASFPVIIPILVFFVEFRKDPGDPQIVDVTFHFSVNGNEVLRQPHRVDFQNQLLCRAITRILVFPINGPGIVKGEVKTVDAKTIGSFEFSVADIQPMLPKTLSEPAVATQANAHKI